jgi:hypothetical protein
MMDAPVSAGELAMAHLDDDNPTAGAGDLNGSSESPSAAGLEQRVKALEQENARLRAELADLNRARELDQLELSAHRLRGLPTSKEQWEQMVATAQPGDEVLGELIEKLERAE